MTGIERIFELRFEREYEDREDTDLRIGLYLTESEALEVAARLRLMPGFRESPEGFLIEPIELGRTYFAEGFVSKWGPPPKDVLAEAFDLPAWIDDDAGPD